MTATHDHTTTEAATTVIALTTPLDLLALRADQVGIHSRDVLSLELHAGYTDTSQRYFWAQFHTSDPNGFLALVDALDLMVESERPETATVAYAVGTLLDGTAVTVCCDRFKVQAAAAVTA